VRNNPKMGREKVFHSERRTIVLKEQVGREKEKEATLVVGKRRSKPRGCGGGNNQAKEKRQERQPQNRWGYKWGA